MGDAKAAGSTILVVDDDVALAEMLQIVLQASGFDTTWVARGDRVLEEFRRAKPDLVLLDLMLPGRDGVDVCRDLRAESDVPIVMLTAKSDTRDVVEGLEAGADDYVAKPFKTQELLARVKTRLRRSTPPEEEADTLRISDVVIDVEAHTVHRGSEPIALTPLEFDLLLALARKPRQAFTRELLLQEVWGYRHPGDTRLVNVHVQRLRSKIERDPERPEIVVTVRGIGYRAGSPTA
ncbi:MAG: response regulator transcription factor [Propionibacteriaceae bacterium]|nr:response regulator transcription factor [Propionibacteriaceae bacterium]